MTNLEAMNIEDEDAMMMATIYAFDTVREEKNFRTVFSIENITVDMLNEPCGRDLAFKWGVLEYWDKDFVDCEVTAMITGNTLADVWSCFEECIKRSGDFHIYLEGIYFKEGRVHFIAGS